MLFTGDIALPYIGAVSYTLPSSFNCHLFLGNLEGSLINDERKMKDLKGVYNSCEAIKHLINQVPFNLFFIANNHLLDAADVQTTLDNAERLGVHVIGAGRNLREAQDSLVITDSDGTCYRILAFGWDSIQCVPAKERGQGVNPYSRNNVMRCAKEALQHEEPVICFMHWDYELERYPQPYDRCLAHELIDMGVAAVIGCHAHRVQPIEFYRGKPIVYGLGNFLFCQGHYMGGKLCFPRFCEDEYVFEITNKGYKLHHFRYDQKENRLVFMNNEEVGPDCEFDGKAEFSGFSGKEYEEWFKGHRVQKKLLPIFCSNESSISYWMKSQWIRIRGGLINLLTRLNLKSANRANR